MLEQATRHAILELHRRGQSVRAIARALQISRAAVRDILRRGTAEVPPLARPEKALEYRDTIVQLLRACEGSRVRPTVAMRITGHETDSMWKRYRIVDEDDIEQALTATQEYVSQQAADKKQRKIVALSARDA